MTLALLSSAAAWGQSNRPERFDTSGMPRRPTTFLEQQIFEMIASHQAGDLADAARIQQKLGRYYTDQGDEERATAAFLAAAAAEGSVEGKPGPPTPAGGQRGPAFSGNYFGYDGRTLHTWEFRADGAFLHSWIASAAGASARNSERGLFRLAGEVLELRITSAASGFVTPGVGGRTTFLGGGAEATGEVRRVKFTKRADGLVLDGVKLKSKSW